MNDRDLSVTISVHRSRGIERKRDRLAAKARRLDAATEAGNAIRHLSHAIETMGKEPGIFGPLCEDLERARDLMASAKVEILRSLRAELVSQSETTKRDSVPGALNPGRMSD